MYRGEIWWANLPDPVGSEPGYRRPVLQGKRIKNLAEDVHQTEED
jgi:mRNA-degrading endonuclease toxin of MazEF toxin-antitoxin module